MPNKMEALRAFVFVVVVVSWFSFGGVFLINRKPTPATKKRDPKSLLGLVLQGFSYALIWIGHRSMLSPLFPEHWRIEGIISVIVLVLSAASVALAISALRALGKEWSLTARVLEEHNLATRGPYAWVRHPIYSAMLGMLLATGVAVSHWQVLTLATVVFFAGTGIRMQTEERLLRETFDADYDDYSRRVSAIVPKIY